MVEPRADLRGQAQGSDRHAIGSHWIGSPMKSPYPDGVARNLGSGGDRPDHRAEFAQAR